MSKSITITREQFEEAIIAASEKFREIGAKDRDEDRAFVDFMMSLQNIAFGGLIANVLFGEDNEDNKEEE